MEVINDRHAYWKELKPDRYQDRHVMLYSWWHSPKSGRKFSVIEKVTKGVTGDRITTIGIRLLEVDDSNPFYRDIEEFWKLVDKGSLVEYCHNAIGSEKNIY